MGNIRNEYGGAETDAVICFFMRTFLRARRYGMAAGLPVDEDLGHPAINAFLAKAISLVEDAQPPEILHLILETEYRFLLQTQTFTRTQFLQLEHLTDALQNWDVGALMMTGNLWRERAEEYASCTFYLNLTEEELRREGMDDMVARLPEAMRQPDQF